MTVSRQVAIVEARTHLFTDWYDEFTCGNATVTAFGPLGGQLGGQPSKLTDSSVTGSPTAARDSALTRGFSSYKKRRRIKSGRR
jgi:hypothetical protein